MKRLSYFLVLTLLATIPGCGSGNNTPTNVGLLGNWNVVMYANGSTTPMFVFALAMSQLGGGSSYSGSSIAYDGSVAIPSNMCINGNALTATATTSGSNFTMTVTDTTSETVITVQGSLATQTTTLSGTYNNLTSTTCSASTGTVTMTPQ
jgi:hypothetical protein